jgi:hypothetical protein
LQTLTYKGKGKVDCSAHAHKVFWTNNLTTSSQQGANMADSRNPNSTGLDI